MARTAITVTSVDGQYLGGSVLTLTSGDAANDHEVSVTAAPKLMLVVINTGANSIDFTIALAAGKESLNSTVNISHTVGNAEYRAIPLDVPSGLWQTGDVIHIDSADANFGDLRFAAYTWNDTPIQ